MAGPRGLLPAGRACRARHACVRRCPSPLPPSPRSPPTPPQEERGAADSYLFDLHHYLNAHSDPSLRPADQAALPPLPASARGGSSGGGGGGPPGALSPGPAAAAEQHLVIDAHSKGASWRLAGCREARLGAPQLVWR